jgi:AcrR family transcriptional regulator
MAATFEMLSEVGFARLSITAVAQRAGVGKPAIYRRWRSKAEMVIDLLDRAASMVLPPPDTGTLRGDLTLIYRQLLNLARLNGGRLQLALLADLPFDAELAEAYRERFVKPRRAGVKRALERAIERGEIRPDTDLDLVCDIGIGVLQHRIAVTGQPIDEALGDRLVDLIILGVGAR